MKMDISRRELAFLVPVLTAAGARAQQPPPETMACKAYDSERIAYTGDETKKGRRFFFEQTHGGFKIEMHETILAAGAETHPPHQHEHEEIVIVTEGTVDANMDGKRYTVPPGSVLVFASNVTHNARNAGTVPCRYYVVELRGNQA